MNVRRSLVGLADLKTGQDSLAWAVRAVRAAVEADTDRDAWLDVGLVLEQLDHGALLDIAITLALLSRQGLLAPPPSAETVHDLVARMAYVWSDDGPAGGGS